VTRDDNELPTPIGGCRVGAPARSSRWNENSGA
jgi:hypothetical protein